mmetsp:Transcript_3430/g.13620  ORF Transcript_3430/g.13620 Transcript_3430/m.13620 type:complete len:228 (-) Transcript_3430:922-1605(-)
MAENTGGPTPSWAEDHESDQAPNDDEPSWARSEASPEPGSDAAKTERDLLLPKEFREDPPDLPCSILFFRGVSLITVCCALCLVAAQVTTLVDFFSGRHVSSLHIPQCVVRFYGVLLCFFAISLEIEWPQVVAETFFGTNWIFRGVLYAFLGVLALEELDEWNAPRGVGSDFITVAGLLQVGVGVWYAGMGIACMKSCRDRARVRHATAMAEYEVREAYRQQIAIQV